MSSTALEIPGWYIEFQTALLRQAPRPGEIGQDVAEGWTNNQKGLKTNLASCLLSPVLAMPIKPSKPTPSILKLVSTVVVSATTGKFVAKDRFVVNIEDNAPVKISAVWENFTNWFLSGDGKTEDSIGEQTLRYHKLRKSSFDGPIITELGGEEKSETTLTEMFSLMEKQKNGKFGTLFNNGRANIFYIRDQNSVLRAIRVFWGAGGWDVYAFSVVSPDRWSVGGRVFSRNSVLESSETSVLAQA